MERKVLIVDESFVGTRLDVFLASNIENITRARIKSVIDQGGVTVDSKVVKAGEKLRLGAIVAIDIPDVKQLDVTAQDVDFDIIYEDNDLLVINKPQGLVVHPCTTTLDGTLVNGLLKRVGNLSSINGVVRPGIVHRLDKMTSGLMLVAKSDSAHKNLAKQIESKQCKRRYYALVEGVVECDEKHIETHIARSASDRKKMAVVPAGKGKIAISDMTVIKRYLHWTLVEFSLKTGRTHQIRVHCKHIGHPVVGDEVYGKKDQKFGLFGQLLHSHYIEFTHPSSGEVMQFECDLPDYFKDVLNKIK